MPLQYHRNEASGPQLTATGTTLTFRSLRDDLAALRAAAPPGVVDSATTHIGTSEQGKPIHAIRLGRNPALPVLIAGCHHAREWLSVEVPYLTAEYLVTKYTADVLVRRIVDSLDLWIVPMVNPDGHERSVLSDRMWRKNFPTVAGRDRVDLNRNYDTSSWGAPRGAFSTSPTNDSYRGPSAGFAAEVQAMQNLVIARKFKATLDYHTFGRFILFPWSGKVTPHPDADQEGMAKRLERVIDPRADYQVLQASMLYPTLRSIPPEDGKVPGGFMDFVVERVPDSIAITVELEPEFTDVRGFDMPQSEIQPTFDKHRGSILAFLNSVGTIKNAPLSQDITLVPGAANDVVLFDPDSVKPFELY